MCNFRGSKTKEDEEDKVRSMDLSEEALTEIRKSRDVRSNIVRTSKYTLLTFFPHNLFL